MRGCLRLTMVGRDNRGARVAHQVRNLGVHHERRAGVLELDGRFDDATGDRALQIV